MAGRASLRLLVSSVLLAWCGARRQDLRRSRVSAKDQQWSEVQKAGLEAQIRKASSPSPSPMRLAMSLQPLAEMSLSFKLTQPLACFRLALSLPRPPAWVWLTLGPCSWCGPTVSVLGDGRVDCFQFRSAEFGVLFWRELSVTAG